MNTTDLCPTDEGGQVTDWLIDLTEQIHEEFGAIAGAMAALLGPTASQLEFQVQARAEMWAAQLLGDDDKEAAQTAIDLMCVRWPGDARPPTDWWGTPLGMAVAASCGYPNAEVVSYSVAAAMLGCTKQNITNLLAARTHRLVRGPNGHGITSESIRERLRAQRG